jgi:hypothetical protein
LKRRSVEALKKRQVIERDWTGEMIKIRVGLRGFIYFPLSS